MTFEGRTQDERASDAHTGYPFKCESRDILGLICLKMPIPNDVPRQTHFEDPTGAPNTHLISYNMPKVDVEAIL